MKLSLIFIAILLIKSLYSQDYSKDIVDRNSTPIDTLTSLSYFSNGQLKSKIVYENSTFHSNSGDKLISRIIYKEKYWKNGQVRETFKYKDYNMVLWEIYFKNGLKDQTFEMEYQSDENITLRHKENHFLSHYSRDFHFSSTYTLNTFWKGHLIFKGSYVNGKKNGVWERYSNKTGKLRKKTTWDMGEKIKVEKF